MPAKRPVLLCLSMALAPAACTSTGIGNESR